MLVALVAWGVLAFGSVYPWTYWPLVGGAWILFVTAWFPLSAQRRGWSGDLRPLVICFGIFVLAVAAQLLPLSAAALHRLSPATADFLRNYNPAFALNISLRHPLSLRPDLTLTALVLACTWFGVVLASQRVFSLTGAEDFLKVLAALGLFVALAGIIQAPVSSGEIYGFWQPESRARSFGPFVNRNHCAGWFLMALPTTVGLLLAKMARGMGTKPTLRHRLLWLSSRDAGGMTFLGGCAVVMAIALLLTMSRSGLLALAVSGGIVAVLMARRLAGAKRVAAFTFLALGALALLTLPQLDSLATRFSADDEGIQQRIGAWQDAVGIFRAFPITGTGLNTYGVASLFYQTHDLNWHYQQAHNDYLQLLAEGGLLLALPAVAMIVVFAALVRRRFLQDQGVHAYWMRVGAVAGLLGVGLQEFLDFSLQMPGNAMLFAVLCGIALHRCSSPLREDSPRDRANSRAVIVEPAPGVR